MSAIKYNPSSPYAGTPQVSNYVDYLDFWSPAVVPPNSQDRLIKLESKYNHRPDLLAYDLYGNSQLWWVFAARNPDVIRDPIYDFRTNTTIYAPASISLGNYI